MADPDALLVERARRGEREAFRALVLRYQNSLLGFCRSRIGERMAAEDVAQEVFIAAYSGLAGLREPERFAAWLFGIARMKLLVHVRRRARSPVLEPLDPDRLPERGAPPAEGDELGALLADLPDEHRIVFLLRFRDDLSYRQIGQRLGLPAGSVGTILHRAKSVLRRRLEAGARERGQE